MSSFTINFMANTTGDHYIGYRTYNDPPNTYTVVTVNVAFPGANSATITVPGNLYCAYDDITYTGYLIAACQDQTDGDLDGIPDLALTWTVVMLEQTDPCQASTIECIATEIDTVVLSNVPGACAPDAVGVVLTVTETNPGDEEIPAIVTCDVVAGAIVNITIVAPGAYKAAPTITLSPYCAPPDPTFTVTMVASCPPITLATYACAGHTELGGEDSEFTLALADTVDACVDTAVPLPAYFSITDNGHCHCNECRHVHLLSGTSTPGTFGKVTYQTCWDTSNPLGQIMMVSRVIVGGVDLDLGCILEDTVNIETGTLDQPVLIADFACV